MRDGEGGTTVPRERSRRGRGGGRGGQETFMPVVRGGGEEGAVYPDQVEIQASE